MRGFLMLLVIFGHISSAGIGYIYSFHMPAYFFLTGMTFTFNKEQNVIRFTLKKFFELMVPYFALSLYVAPLREWLEHLGEVKNQGFVDLIIGTLYSNGDSGYKMASNTLWFIPCLFLTSLIFFFIQKSTKNKTPLVVISCILLTAVAWGLHLNTGSGGVMHYKGAIFSVLFVAAGYVFAGKIIKINKWIHIKRAGAFLLSLVMIAVAVKLSEKNGYVSIIRNDYDSLILFYTCALLSIIGITLLFMMGSRSESFMKLAKPFEVVGKITLPYIAFQVPLAKLIWYYMPDTFGTKELPWAILQTAILFFGMIPLAKLIDKITPRKLPKRFRK